MLNKGEKMRCFEEGLFRRLGEEIASAYADYRYDDAKKLARIADWLMTDDEPSEEIAPEGYNRTAKEAVAIVIAAIQRRRDREAV